MTAQNNETETDQSTEGTGPLAFVFDTNEFMHFLSETDWDENQKLEYLALVWGIVCEFVTLGYGVHPIQQVRNSCGELPESRYSQTTQADRLIDSSHGKLIEEFVRRNTEHPGADERGVNNE